jgi:copper transport protein
VSPADGARLDTAPTEVRVEFTESVSAPSDAVRVLDTNGGGRVDDGEVVVEGSVVTVRLRPGLGTGGYVVTWNIQSADSHPVSGASVFTVGDAATPDKAAVGALAGGDGGTGWKTVGALSRAAGYLGVLLAAGTAAFLALVHDGDGQDRRRLLGLVLGGSALGLIGLLAEIPTQAALLTDRGAGALFDEGVLRSVLGNGVGWTLAAAVFGLALVAVTVTGTPSGFNRAVTVGGAALAAGSFAAAGHPDTLTSPLLAGAIDAVHLLAAAVWFGGLVALLVVMASRAEPLSAARVVARFSLLATVAVVAVAGAGAYLAWQEVGSLDGLTGTTYGRLILAKVAAVSAAAMLGLLNNRRLVPALTRAPERATALLRRTVRIEAVILMGVVFVTAVLVNISPPVAGATGGPISVRVPLDGGAGTAEVSLEPGRVGTNLMHVYLADAAGQPLTLERFELRASLVDGSLGPLTRDGDPTGLAHWTVTDIPLSLAGRWQIELSGDVDQFTAVTGRTQVDVPS